MTAQHLIFDFYSIAELLNLYFNGHYVNLHGGLSKFLFLYTFLNKYHNYI